MTTRNKKALFSIIGFLLFIFGFLSILLGMVGIKIVFLLWIDALGRLGAFLFKLTMIIAGVTMIILTRGDEARFDDYLTDEEA